MGLKAPKKEKFVNKPSQPPVESPYVPPPTKSLLHKTVDIFDGITILELSKRTAYPLSTLHAILVNLGEKPHSDFDPLTLDVAELVSMVSSALHPLYIPPLHLVSFYFSSCSLFSL